VPLFCDNGICGCSCCGGEGGGPGNIGALWSE
jgi:hypothetical protein